MVAFLKKKKQQDNNKVLSIQEVKEILERDAQTLSLAEDEKLLGTLPIYMGIRDHINPTHSYSCSSVRSDIEGWRLGGFITTTKYFIFRRMNEDRSFSTAIKVPLEGIYEVEVSGLDEKRLELLTDAGSFEFTGWDNESIYNFKEVFEKTIEFTKNEKSKREFPSVQVVTCQYCKTKNRAVDGKCSRCGAPIT